MTLQIDPKEKAALFNKGIVYLNLNGNKKAIKCYDLALNTDPKDINVLNNKGVAY